MVVAAATVGKDPYGELISILRSINGVLAARHPENDRYYLKVVRKGPGSGC